MLVKNFLSQSEGGESTTNAQAWLFFEVFLRIVSVFYIQMQKNVQQAVKYKISKR